jgi:hypothetical protein
MEKKIIVTALLIALLSVVFSMSGDGGNVPVVPKKEAVNVNVPSQDSPKGDDQGNYKQAENKYNGETVKDRFGIDTGMTKEEFEEFKGNFFEKAKEIGLPEGRDGYNSYFRMKINLNSYEVLKDIGADIKWYGFPTSKSHLENTLYSDVVLIGDIYERVYVDDQKFYKSYYKVKVIDILKGASLVKDEFGNIISVLSKNGKNFSTSDETEMKIGERRLFFLIHKLGEDDRFATTAKSEGLIIGDKLYSVSGNVYIGDLKTETDRIKKIVEVNDSENFYKRNYRSEVEK